MDRLTLRMDPVDLADLRSWVAREYKGIPFTVACRHALLHCITSNGTPRGRLLDAPERLPSFPDQDPDPDQKEDQEKKNTRGMLPDASETPERHPLDASETPPKKRRTRQTTMIDDDATRAATAFILALNEAKGSGYETTGGAFAETVRMIRWHMDNDHRTETDFVLVARWSPGAWKGGIQEKNAKPATLLRQSLFGNYLAEARASTGYIPPLSEIEKMAQAQSEAERIEGDKVAADLVAKLMGRGQ